MRLDSQLAFVPVGAPLSFSGGTGTLYTSNVIDLLGLGSGVNPSNFVIWGNSTVFGEDPGIGTNRPELMVAIGTAATTSNSATLNIQFQAAVDSGTPNFTPGTWNTVVETGYISAANLTANQVVARFPWLPEFPASTRPRFLRLGFQVLASTAFTAGTIAFAIPTFVRDDQANKYQTKNYTVA